MILTKEKKDFFIILIGKILQVVVMIISIKVMTALLPAKEMGSVYLFTTVYTFFVLAFISPFGQYINRHTHAWWRNKSLLNNLTLYILYLILVGVSAVIIGYILYSFGILNHITLFTFLLLLFFSILFMTLNQTIIPLLNMLHYRFSFTILTLLTSLGILVFGYIFIDINGAKSSGWLWGIVVSNVIFMFIGALILWNNLHESFATFLKNTRKITRENLKSILKFVLPLSIATLFMWLQNSGYRIVVEQKIGLEFLGFLGVGLAVSGQIAGVFESIAMQYFHPIYYEKISHSDLEGRTIAINELINKVLPIYLMLAIFLTFLAKYVVETLVDENYYGVYIFTIFGVWMEFFRMTTNLLGNISQSEMNTKKFILPYFVGSMATLFLVYFSSLTTEYKLYLPMALTIGGFITFIFMYISMKKLINFSINYILLFYAFLLSIPYTIVCLFSDYDVYIGLLIVCIFGLYFLGTIYFVYKKGLKYDYS